MLSRLGQVNHYYVDAYYGDRLCGFPQCSSLPRESDELAPGSFAKKAIRFVKEVRLRRGATVEFSPAF